MVWRILGRCIEGQPFTVAGVNVWDLPWESGGPDPVEITDPTCRETYQLRRYQMLQANRLVAFAAGETSANVWMFCVEQ
jgi:hypothetical protein